MQRLDVRLSIAVLGITVGCLGCSEDNVADVSRQNGADDSNGGSVDDGGAAAEQASSQGEARNSADAALSTSAADGVTGEETTSRDNTVSADDLPDGEGTTSTDDIVNTDDPGVDEPSADDPSADEPSADEPSADEPSADDPGVDDPGADDPGGTLTDEAADDSANTDDMATVDDALPPDGACTIAGQRVLRLPAVFRDFSDTHEDFGELPCSGDVVTGAVEPVLDAEGRPVAGPVRRDSCIGSAVTFSEWYTDSALNVRVPGEVVLFDDGAGGFVNRFGVNGEQFSVVDSASELGPTSDEPTCAISCTTYVSYTAPCLAECGALQAEVTIAEEAYAAAADLADAGAPDLDELQAQLQTRTAELAACNARCDVDKAVMVDECQATCKPCSYVRDLYCMYGTTSTYDGDPLFFPVDQVTGPTRDPAEAKLPDAFGYPSWPWESEVFGEVVEHNFYFTTELEIPFVYTAGLDATIEFLGDDDAWVFINGNLAIDLGGLHTPISGLATIDASTASSYGLVEGQTHTISIFHAERQMEGSSFKLALRGFQDLGDSPCGVQAGVSP